MKDFERKIQKTNGKKIVVTEGIFSMDGDWSKLDRNI